MSEYSLENIKKILFDVKNSSLGLGSGSPGSLSEEASKLRLSVTRNGVRVVDLSFPAGSARWIIQLIPEDIALKIQSTGVSLVEIQAKLNLDEKLLPQSIFILNEPERVVRVWLE